MASLLARFYEPQDGAIKIDGNDTRDLTLDSLRGNIAMVLQPPLVLGDTMRVNVAFGKPAVDDAKVLRAIEMARLDRSSPSCRPDSTKWWGRAVTAFPRARRSA